MEIPRIYSGMLAEISRYKRSKEELMQYYINKRLTKSLQTYYHELTAEVDSLAHRNELKVMRNINKG